jgi:hypothetical protein
VLHMKITLDGTEYEVDAGSVGEGIKIIREEQEAEAKGFLSVQEMHWAKANGFANKAEWWAAEQKKG